MKKSCLYLFSVLVLTLFLPFSLIAKESMKIKNVTIFKNSAFLEHEVDYNFKKGQSVIVLENISHNVMEESIQIALPEGVELVNFKFKSIDLTQKEIDYSAETNYKKLLDEKKLYQEINNELETIRLTKNILQNSSKSSEVIKGLKAEEMESWMLSFQKKMSELIKKEQELELKKADKEKEIKRIEANGYNINNLVKKGELYLTVRSNHNINGKIYVNYGSNQAGWTPQYEYRYESKKQKFSILYKAIIQQSTGIDWKDASVTLASSEPLRYTSIPVLNPWFINFINNESNQNLVHFSRPRNEMLAAKENHAPVYGDSQSGYAEMVENHNFNSFEIAEKVNVRSHGESQHVNLMLDNFEIDIENQVVPKVMQYAQRVGKVLIENKGQYLPGKATVFYDNQMVGTTYMNSNQFGDTLKVSFGEENRIVTQRKKIKDYSSKKIIGSTKTQEYQFEIKIENKKSSSEVVYIKEQVPISTDKELEVIIEGYGNAKWDKEKGILEWELNMDGGEVQTLVYTLKLKYPKDNLIPKIY